MLWFDEYFEVFCKKIVELQFWWNTCLNLTSFFLQISRVSNSTNKSIMNTKGMMHHYCLFVFFSFFQEFHGTFTTKTSLLCFPKITTFNKSNVHSAILYPASWRIFVEKSATQRSTGESNWRPAAWPSLTRTARAENSSKRTCASLWTEFPNFDPKIIRVV